MKSQLLLYRGWINNATYVPIAPHWAMENSPVTFSVCMSTFGAKEDTALGGG